MLLVFYLSKAILLPWNTILDSSPLSPGPLFLCYIPSFSRFFTYFSPPLPALFFHKHIQLKKSDGSCLCPQQFLEINLAKFISELRFAKLNGNFLPLTYSPFLCLWYHLLFLFSSLGTLSLFGFCDTILWWFSSYFTGHFLVVLMGSFSPFLSHDKCWCPPGLCPWPSFWIYSWEIAHHYSWWLEWPPVNWQLLNLYLHTSSILSFRRWGSKGYRTSSPSFPVELFKSALAQIQISQPSHY